MIPFSYMLTRREFLKPLGLGLGLGLTLLYPAIKLKANLLAFSQITKTNPKSDTDSFFITKMGPADGHLVAGVKCRGGEVPIDPPNDGCRYRCCLSICTKNDGTIVCGAWARNGGNNSTNGSRCGVELCR